MFFVVIEGIDGVGKSSLVKEMRRRTLCAQPAVPSRRLRAYRDWIDQFSSSYVHYLFYKKCMKDLSEEVLTHSQEDLLVVVDRYWYSTVATHRVLEVECSKDEFLGLAEPNLVLFLTADESVQRERMISRGLDHNDRKLLGRNQELVEHFLKVLPDRTKIIDTTNLSIEVLCDFVCEYLQGVRGGLNEKILFF